MCVFVTMYGVAHCSREQNSDVYYCVLYCTVHVLYTYIKHALMLRVPLSLVVLC